MTLTLHHTTLKSGSSHLKVLVDRYFALFISITTVIYKCRNYVNADGYLLFSNEDRQRQFEDEKVRLNNASECNTICYLERLMQF